MEKNAMKLVYCMKCGRQIVEHVVNDQHCIGPSKDSVKAADDKFICPDCVNN
jgi:hypothetical protein